MVDDLVNGGDNIIETLNHDIVTEGLDASGIYAVQLSPSKIDIDIEGGSVTTKGTESHGIFGGNLQSTSTDAASDTASGDIIIKTLTHEIVTEGTSPDSAVTAHGIFALQQKGLGKIDIYLEGGSIETRGYGSYGVFGWGQNKESSTSNGGDIIIETLNHKIVTEGAVTGTYVSAHGIYAHQDNALGKIDIDLKGGSVTTKGNESNGVYGFVANTANEGDIIIKTKDYAILTESTDLEANYGDAFSIGLFARHAGLGNIKIDLQGGSIETKGIYSYGVYGNLENANNGGELSIRTGGGHTITTTGAIGHGIVAYNFGTLPTSTTSIYVGGNITTTGAGAQGVRVGSLSSGAPARVAPIGGDGYRKSTVTVNGAVKSAAEGVYLAGGGKVVIGPMGSIRSASGIAILATGDTPVDGGDPLTPKLSVNMKLDGRLVVDVIGDDWIINDGGETTILVNDVKLHDGEEGVVFESDNTTPVSVPNGARDVSIREDGLTVDRTTPSAWMFSTRSTSTIADRDFSTGDFNETARPTCPAGHTGMPPNCVPPPTPMCPAGHTGMPPNCVPPPTPMCPAGHTGMPPNCVPPPTPMCPAGHTGMPPNCVPPPTPMCPAGHTGMPPNCVPPPTPMCPAGQVGTPPDCITPPSMCPSGQVGTPPNCTEPEPEQPMFREEYAPRAAVYEALPDFLLRLTGPGPARNCRSAPDEPAWVRFAGGQGSYEADRSTTGATYDLERFETEGGLSAAFTDRVKGWVSVRHVWGAAGIGSPTGGGQIDVRGLGSTVGGAWQGANDLYAVGCFSYMAYNVDFASHKQGLLKAGTKGHVYTLDFEAGRRFALTGQVDVTPRFWVVGSRVAVNSFTDAVDARVSFADADRVSGGLGLMADTTRPWGEGEFTLQGSVDYARIVKGAQTRVEVSGERLRAIATGNSLLFGLNGVYRQGRFSIGAEVAARQELGSDDNEYASFLNVGMQF